MAIINFDNIFGQDKAKKLLFRSFQKDKVSHAYLFRGLAGVGKKTTALGFALYLNCLNRSVDDFCGTCSSCLKFASNNHPDYYEILPDGAGIKIDQIRELKKKLAFASFEAKYRVVMLPDIHLNMRRDEVANSLLKTIEEPPGDTVFILTADETGSVLSTILSRCQVIPFNPLPFAEVSRRLQGALSINQEDANTLAAVTGGSYGMSLTMSEQGLLDLRLDMIESIMALDKSEGVTVEKIMVLAQRAAELKEDLFDYLDLLKLWIRDLLIINFGIKPSLILNQDLNHTFDVARERWTLTELYDKIGMIDLAKKQLTQNCNRISVCEMLLWKLL